MSELARIRAQVVGIANDTKTTAAGMSAFKSKFSTAVGQVQATIGGTATGADKQMIATLQAAEKQLEACVAALQQASQAASGWAAQA